MPNVMNANVVEPRPCLDPSPVPGKPGEMGVRFAAPDQPGIALDALDAGEHRQYRRRQGHHARTRLAVPKPNLP